MTERVLVLDASVRQSLAACRALGRAGHEVGAAGYGAGAPAGHSRFTARYHELPDPAGDGRRFADALEGIIERFRYSAVLATDDPTLARLNLQAPSVPAIPTPGEGFTLLTDKSRLARLAEREGVDYPETHPADTPEQVDEAIRLVGLPAIVKSERTAAAAPDRVACAKGAQVVRDLAAARAAAAALVREGLQPIVQRRVHWTEKINVVVVRRDGRSELRYAQRVLRELPPEGGTGITLETLAPEDVRAHASLEALERVCDGAGYEGLAQAELYLGEGRTWLIDVNPRLWGSTSFAEGLGLRVSERALRVALGQPALPDQPVYRPGSRFHHLLGELRWVAAQRPVRRSFVAAARDWRPGDHVEYLDWGDLRPLASQVAARVRRR